MTQAALLYRNARLATMRAGAAADGDPYGLIDKGAVAIRAGRVLWAGAEADMPALRAAKTIDLEGRLVTPGLIDCHTHLVYAGDRADEFEKRLRGMSYAEIARAGGGIQATVKAVRAASEEDLFAASLPRFKALVAEGATTVEIKSGYGLDLANEAKMLRVSARLGGVCGATVRRTYLGAHALPAEFAGDADGYIDDICKHQLPALAAEGLVDAVDAFCEHIGFSSAQVERLFTAARALGLPVKLHAEQLSNLGGAALAARSGALSADHLEHLDEAGAAAMAKAGTAAILLPGAYYFLQEETPPPIGLLRKHGVAMAVATDCNPGSAPLSSILLAMNMACVLFGLTPAEALMGATRHAAQALGLGNEIGVIEAGKWADLAIWDATHPAALAYGMGSNPLYRRLWRGND